MLSTVLSTNCRTGSPLFRSDLTDQMTSSTNSSNICLFLLPRVMWEILLIGILNCLNFLNKRRTLKFTTRKMKITTCKSISTKLKRWWMTEANNNVVFPSCRTNPKRSQPAMQRPDEKSTTKGNLTPKFSTTPLPPSRNQSQPFTSRKRM